LSKSERPELTSAKIVISGAGRCSRARTSANISRPIADRARGPPFGASRAAVDAGYAPNDWQVGQTGKVVRRSCTLRSGFPAPSSISPE